MPIGLLINSVLCCNAVKLKQISEIVVTELMLLTK